MKSIISFLILIFLLIIDLVLILKNENILATYSIFSTIILTIFIFYYNFKKEAGNSSNYTEHMPTRDSLLSKLREFKNKKPKSLILINIDSFEDINDFFGYDFGDKVLGTVYKWIKANLPDDSSRLYKLEADNYAIFTENFNTKEELSRYLKALSRKIVDTNFVIDDNELDIGFTMGAAINENHLLKLTHSAFKSSKIKKTQFEIYNKNKNDEDIHIKNIKINKIIKKALQNHSVIPYYQPIYNINLNKIDKYECLMRIDTQQNSVLMPSDFLDISKKSKLYPRLTKEIFSKIAEGINASKAEYSINLSVIDILDKDVNYYILNKLEKSDIGSWLVFEILESEGIKNYKEVTHFIRNVKALGAKVAIDDFGSGYSNFEYILKLDVDFLKIDGSLIRNIDINEDAQIISGTIVDFAKKLNIKTIAEYVHNQEVYKKIKQLGFDYAQGYYIGKPEKHLCSSKDLSYLSEDDDNTLFN